MFRSYVIHFYFLNLLFRSNVKFTKNSTKNIYINPTGPGTRYENLGSPVQLPTCPGGMREAVWTLILWLVFPRPRLHAQRTQPTWLSGCGVSSPALFSS